MRYISDILIEKIIERKSPVVVGLDPDFEKMPKEITLKYLEKYGVTLKAVSESIMAFNKGIIDAIYDLVPAVKPQIAFYEQYGIEGLIAYKWTCDYAKEKGLIVIADVKRGDIGSTSQAYANAYLGHVQVGSEKISAFESDYATVNPYLGDDCLVPFVTYAAQAAKGIFVLVKTSNATSSQIQDLKVNGTDETVYDQVADMVNHWNNQVVGDSGYSPIGAVVGATYPEELITLRSKMPKAIFLVPGYGAQGGGGDDVVGAFNADGLGAIVNSSRGILYAYLKCDLGYAEAAREATQSMIADINDALARANKKYWV